MLPGFLGLPSFALPRRVNRDTPCCRKSIGITNHDGDTEGLLIILTDRYLPLRPLEGPLFALAISSDGGPEVVQGGTSFLTHLAPGSRNR
jgi:hypothetical protein